MQKNKTLFVCSQCGGEHLRWSGKCSFCEAWNTLKELSVEQSTPPVEEVHPVRLKEIETLTRGRMSTGIDELDLVLGGGMVPGSVILLGGHPGIGKSTLVWQAACNLKGTVAYVAAEESPEQIKIRALRLKKKFDHIVVFDNQDIASLKQALIKLNPVLIIIDSIQTIFDSRLGGSPGSVMQVKSCALEILNLAKKNSIATILVGHVTKEGEVAGPKTLEHLVDAVFYLDGQSMASERFLRSVKNRFGPTDELGVFRLTEGGLVSSSDFGRLAPTDYLPQGVARTAVCEGSKVYFVEVQSLVQKTNYGFPKRTSVGFDQNRLQMIIAILARHTKVNLSDFDVFINIADGYKLKDPIADLAVLFSLAASFYAKSAPGKSIFIGEIDLAGRIHLGETAKKIIKVSKKIGYNIETLSKLALDEQIAKILK